MKKISFVIPLISFTLMLASSTETSLAQSSGRKVRIAKIEIYPQYLEEYKADLAEHAKAAVTIEPGVLSLQAVYDKDHPTLVTVFEIYSSENAYETHLKTAHFLKYKTGTQKMVKSLELIEVEPIAIEIKPELVNKVSH